MTDFDYEDIPDIATEEEAQAHRDAMDTWVAQVIAIAKERDKDIERIRAEAVRLAKAPMSRAAWHQNALKRWEAKP
jgi:hypothetical protein